jgi:hypothetical protein
VSQVNVNEPGPAAPPPVADGSGYGFVVGIIVAILVIALVLWLLVFNNGTPAPGNTDGGGGGTTPMPSAYIVRTLA